MSRCHDSGRVLLLAVSMTEDIPSGIVTICSRFERPAVGRIRASARDSPGTMRDRTDACLPTACRRRTPSASGHDNTARREWLLQKTYAIITEGGFDG